MDIAGGAEAVWDALVEGLDETGRSARARRLADVLGCSARDRSGEPGSIGSTIPGFVVTRSIPPAVLALMGQHRFSRYALVFRVNETLAGPTRLSAETRAEFPGARGRAYRTLVIDTRFHVLATRSILRSVRRRAERG